MFIPTNKNANYQNTDLTGIPVTWNRVNWLQRWLNKCEANLSISGFWLLICYVQFPDWKSYIQYLHGRKQEANIWRWVCGKCLNNRLITDMLSWLLLLKQKLDINIRSPVEVLQCYCLTYNSDSSDSDNVIMVNIFMDASLMTHTIRSS